MTGKKKDRSEQDVNELLDRLLAGVAMPTFRPPGTGASCSTSGTRRGPCTVGIGTTIQTRGSSRRKIPSASPVASTCTGSQTGIPSTSPTRSGCVPRVSAHLIAAFWTSSA